MTSQAITGDGENSAAFSRIVAADELVALTERELQVSIVEPLLRVMGFTDVYDTTGTVERGKDLIARKADDFGRPYLYAIQIKRFKPSARHGSPDSFGVLLDQLKSTLLESVFDPATNQRRLPNGLIFITPYAVPPRIREAFEGRASDPLFRMLTIVDGPKLVDLILERLPQALPRFSLATQYRLRLIGSLNRIKESAVAFDLNEELTLDAIYVDVSLGYAEPDIHNIAVATRLRRTRLLVQLEPDDLRRVNRIYRDWAKSGATVLPTIVEKSETRTDLLPLFAVIRDRVRSVISALDVLSSPTSRPTACTQAVSSLVRLNAPLASARRDKVLRDHWGVMLPARPREAQAELRLNAETLLKIREHIHIVGIPGSGKTTLLRRLAQTRARRDRTILPVFLPLVTVRDVSYGGLIRAISRELECQGLNTRPSRASTLLDDEDTYLCLDGLDEMGGSALAMLEIIEEIRTRHRRCHIVLSSRDTVGLPLWSTAFAVKVRPFSNEQQVDFVRNWFSAQPSARDGLCEWLQQNDGMRESARTPLIAALLCSLFQAQAEMPATEIELYERRFELLLGKWEHAKGLPQLQTAVRRRYLHFLRGLAFEMHISQTRTASIAKVTALATRYYATGLHAGPESLVEDCVKRGLLEQESLGALSLGHLTYQEFLVAQHLSETNPVRMVWKEILNPWWAKAFDFYAAMKLDISSLLAQGLKYRSSGALLLRIGELAKLAPLTRTDVVEALRKLPRGSHHA